MFGNPIFHISVHEHTRNNFKKYDQIESVYLCATANGF